MESRLAGLLPPPLFELVQQSGNSSIQAVYSFVPRSYARDRLCLVGDAGTLFAPFAGSAVLRAVASATSLTETLADASAVDDALRRWSEAQFQVAAQVIPVAEGIERSYVFDMPDLTTMPTTATNDWMSAASSGLAVRLAQSVQGGKRLQERLLHDVVRVAGTRAQPHRAGQRRRPVPLDQQPERGSIARPGQPNQIPVADVHTR